jgi:hypothetical protein
MEKRMRTNSPAAATAMWMAITSVALAGAAQEKIPALQREALKGVESETLTGCVTRDTGADTYKLTNVRPKSVTKDLNNAAKDGELSNEMFAQAAVRLSTSDVDLAKHVGHRVSVTGLYAGAGWRQPFSSTLERGGHGTLPILNVKSLTMVADSCSEPADVQ